jgi:hypothetical protein
MFACFKTTLRILHWKNVHHYFSPLKLCDLQWVMCIYEMRRSVKFRKKKNLPNAIGLDSREAFFYFIIYWKKRCTLIYTQCFRLDVHLFKNRENTMIKKCCNGVEKNASIDMCLLQHGRRLARPKFSFGWRDAPSLMGPNLMVPCAFLLTLWSIIVIIVRLINLIISKAGHSGE